MPRRNPLPNESVPFSIDLPSVTGSSHTLVLDSNINIEPVTSIKVRPKKLNSGATKARNDKKWEALRDEIRQLYLDEDRSLLATRSVMEEKHGFKYSERKWKDKLDEWGYTKYVSNKDMQVLVQKAEKRLRDEGKDTEIYHHGKLMTTERLERFKRKKVNHEQVYFDDPTDVATPPNFVYHTPRPHLNEEVIQCARDTDERDQVVVPAATPDSNIVSKPQKSTSNPIPDQTNQLEAFQDLTIVNHDHEEVVHHPEQDEITAVIPRLSTTGAKAVISEAEALQALSESQSIRYILDVSKNSDMTTSRFERLVAIFLRKRLNLLQQDCDGDTHRALYLYLDLFGLIERHGYFSSPIALHFNCRLACLLSSRKSYSAAGAMYRIVVKRLNRKTGAFRKIMKVRCFIALSSIHLMQEEPEKAYVLLAENLPRYFSDAIRIQSNKIVDGLEDFTFEWPSLFDHSNQIIEPLKLLEPFIGRDYHEVYGETDVLDLMYGILGLISLLMDRKHLMNEHVLDRFFVDLLNLLELLPAGTEGWDSARSRCMKYFIERGNAAQVQRRKILREDEVNMMYPVVNPLPSDLPKATIHWGPMSWDDGNDLLPDLDDEDENKSKYGVTYSCSTITGVSYSELMVP